MRLFGFFVGLLLFSVPAFADPPTLALPDKVSGKPGDFISVASKTNGKNVCWIALDKDLHLFPVALLKDTRTAVVTCPTPGSYRLLAVTAAGDEISAPAICQIVIEGMPPPTPTPAPPGPAPPAPAPTSKAAWAIVILDNNARTAAMGQLLGSPSLFASLQQIGVSLRVLDVADPLVKSNGYQKSVDAAGGPPVLLIYDAAGHKIKILKLPATEAAFLDEFASSRRKPALSLSPFCPTCPNGQCTFPEVIR